MPMVPLRALVRRLVVAAVLVSVASASAAEASKKRQAAILARVLSYELTLDERSGSSVGVAVVYKPGNAASEANADDWLRAFEALSSLKIKDKPFFSLRVPYGASELAAAVERQGADVLLLADGLGAEAPLIARYARSKQVLTASNDAALVERHTTVAVTEEGDKLKVVINLASAQGEGVRFSSHLLKLAKLIR